MSVPGGISMCPISPERATNPKHTTIFLIHSQLSVRAPHTRVEGRFRVGARKVSLGLAGSMQGQACETSQRLVARRRRKRSESEQFVGTAGFFWIHRRSVFWTYPLFIWIVVASNQRDVVQTREPLPESRLRLLSKLYSHSY